MVHVPGVDEASFSRFLNDLSFWPTGILARSMLLVLQDDLLFIGRIHTGGDSLGVGEKSCDTGVAHEAP